MPNQTPPRRGQSPARPRRGRTGRAYTSALPAAFAGIAHLGELTAGAGRDRLQANIRTEWGDRASSTFNAKRAAVASALSYVGEKRWLTDPAGVLHGLAREHQPTTPTRDVDPASRRRRMTYRTAERHLGTATGGWDLHDLRHSRLTHAGEDGATEADLMNLSGHEDRRTLQRYLQPSKEGTQRRLDGIEAQRGTWTPSADELADRVTTR